METVHRADLVLVEHGQFGFKHKVNLELGYEYGFQLRVSGEKMTNEEACARGQFKGCGVSSRFCE